MRTILGIGLVVWPAIVTASVLVVPALRSSRIVGGLVVVVVLGSIVGLGRLLREE